MLGRRRSAEIHRQRHVEFAPAPAHYAGRAGCVHDDVAQTLDKFAVPPTERAEVVAIVESTRADIVV